VRCAVSAATSAPLLQVRHPTRWMDGSKQTRMATPGKHKFYISSTHASTHSTMHPCIHASMHPCIQPCNHATMHPSMHPCTHPLIHVFDNRSLLVREGGRRGVCGGMHTIGVRK
jgi:hypothetical protein